MILMYHHVAPRASIPSDPVAADGWAFHHSPEGFERQLRELLRRGYRFESLDDCVRTIRRTGAEAPRAAQVTFDDGWLDNYEHALPILSRLGLTATFFVTSDHLRRGENAPQKMTRAQLRELLSAGMTIGGHTRSHATLTALSESEATTEIAGCKDDLEQSLGTEIELFAYPGGAFDASVARIVRESGYSAACSNLGPARNDSSSTYWLYRDLLTERMDTLGDRYRLSRVARRLLESRVRRRLTRRLHGGRRSEHS
jgi:peptidoglycan/xylan/chitin deacetylase (PgdA/CDA1 family)